MPALKAQAKKALEARTMTAHRAYLDALLVWERAKHLAICPSCRSNGLTDIELERRCNDAAAHTAVCRTAFRDLCGQLGYIPQLPFCMPKEDETRCLCKQAN